MPDLSMGMTQRPLSEIFDWVRRGDLALPELQRPSVWGTAKIPSLLESVYKDYPFGIMLIWTPRPGREIHCRPFQFDNSTERRTPRTAKHYLIDGQQRLTSFYRTLYDDGDLQVAFNVLTEEFSLIDGQVRSKLENPKKHGWYRLRPLLKMGIDEIYKVMREQNRLNQKSFDLIFGMQGRLQRLLPQKISVAFYNIHEKEYGEVAEIFERINLGTPVKESQVVLGKLSTFYPGVVANVEAYLEKSREKHGCNFDLDFFVATLAVVARGYAELAVLPDHYEECSNVATARARVEADVSTAKEAIGHALRFMDRHLFMDTMKYIPSQRTLTCLSYLLLRYRECRTGKSESQQVALWAAQSLLIGHHGDRRWFRADIAIIREADEEVPPLDDLMKNLRRHGVKPEIENSLNCLDDMETPISRNDILFDFLYALMRWKGAVSFPSGKPIQTQRVDDDNDEEDIALDRPPSGILVQEHHIYPVGRLKQQIEGSEGDGWLDTRWIHDIANITFILAEDNFGLRDPPIEYLDDINPAIRAQHLIDVTRYRRDDYRELLTARRKMIKRALKEYFRRLHTN